MVVLKGQGVLGGVAKGTLRFYKKEECTIKRYHVEDTDMEIKRLQDANEQAEQELRSLYEKAVAEMGEANAQIFDVHQMMLRDPDYQESIINMIRSQSVNAEYAVGMTGDNFSEMFSSMDDAYFKERASDIKDVSERLVRVLADAGKALGKDADGTERAYILAADDLVPSETVQLDKSKILAFVTRKGSVNSHTAIIARTLGIPAIVDIGDELLEAYAGKTVIVDGISGSVYIDPDKETEERLRKLQQEEMEKKHLLEAWKGRKTVTANGRTIHLYANIGNVADAASALQNDAEGIGLFRSEFLYLENEDYPTEEQQFRAYKTIAEIMAGKKVIIRTLDIGADKQIPYFNLPKEENPAMGFRAIRICLERPDVFRTQLRAILRASAYGKIAVMFPMIISKEEVLEIKRILEDVKEELRVSGISFDEELETGIMIETPAAVMISDQLAEEVDFFSIGTNDLTQYTLAIDRQNPKLDRFYDPHHPSVLRMIEMTVNSAHAKGIWAGICGELGSDLTLTETFLSMGIDELSVSPSMILPLRKKIKEV